MSAAAAGPVVLDATAPLIQPRDLRTRLADVVAGGVDAVLTTAASVETFRTAMAVMAQWLALDRSGAYPIGLARSVAQIRAAKAAGVTAVVLHFQGAEPIEDDVNLLDVFHACGLRAMQLTYNARNRIGDGCFEDTDIGLSRFGKTVVRRLEALGIVVDLAHAGRRTALEAAAEATGPIVVTHANARALHDNPRNVADEVIRAVAASGGVIGVCAVPFFTTDKPRVTLDDVLAHINHIAGLVGPEHVGLGFDFCIEDEDDYVYYGYDERYVPHPPWVWPEGLSGHAEVGNIPEALRARGFSPAEVQGILGENFLRVFEEVWGG